VIDKTQEYGLYGAMNVSNARDTFLYKWQEFSVPVPEFQIVLGSGFGLALDSLSKEEWEAKGDILFSEIPGLSKSTAPDHAGCYRVIQHKKTGKSILAQMGRLHGYEGNSAKDVAQAVILPRIAGVKNFILTNAAGALTLAFKPGDVMLLRDHVNLTGQNPLAGENPTYPDGKELGPRFPDLGNLYNRDLRNILRESFLKQDLTVHEGVYLGVNGPSFETPAEVTLFSSWGLHAVGMSTVWEAIALKHSGAKVVALSLISNLGAGMSNETLDHFQILDTCRASAAKVISGIFATIAKEINNA